MLLGSSSLSLFMLFFYVLGRRQILTHAFQQRHSLVAPFQRHITDDSKKNVRFFTSTRIQLKLSSTTRRSIDDDSGVLPTYDNVLEAADLLEGVAHRTPVLTSRTLNSELQDCKVFLKCENFQRMGAFKFRGAYNALAHLTREQLESGVVTFSSGNHGQALALAGQLLGCQNTTIVMPRDAPPLKIQATREYGGNAVLYDRYTQDRTEIAAAIQAETGATMVPPFDDPYIIAGQGTSGKELLEECRDEHDTVLDYLFVCVGGGGLIGGCALSAAALSPSTIVIGVEPAAGNDAQQSLAQGRIVRLDQAPATIADGAQTQAIGELTFALMHQYVDRIVAVDDADLIREMQFLGSRMKMIVEPTGCLGLAGLRKLIQTGEIPPGSKCGVLISGGNVDLQRYSELVTTDTATTSV